MVKHNSYARIAGDIFYIFNAPNYEPKEKQKKAPRKYKIIPIKTDYFTQEKIEVMAHVHGEIYGIPTTLDLTLWIAFLQIVYEDFFDGEKVHLPITFKSKELLKRAHHTWDDADAYETVKQWLLRMDGVQIHLQGEKLKTAEPEKGESRKKKKQDWIIRTFSDVKMFGEEDDMGNKLEFNSVWLSKYMLDNIEHNLPAMLDFETYRKIPNQTARLMIVHLQKWLYASRGTKVFEKDYADLCNLLGLTENTEEARIRQQFARAVVWLDKYDYTEDFEILKKKGGGGWKIRITAGEKRELDAKLLKKIGKNANPEAELKLILPPAPSAAATFSDKQSIVYRRLIEASVFERSAQLLVRTRDLGRLARQLAYATEKADIKEIKDGFKSSRRDYIWGILKKDEELPAEYQTPDEIIAGKIIASGDGKQKARETERQDWLKNRYRRFCFAEGQKSPGFSRSAFKESFAEPGELWAATLKVVAKELDSQVFEAWFKRLDYAGCDEQRCRVFIAANEVTREWIGSYYAELLERAAGETGLARYEIKWLTADGSPPPDAPLTLAENYERILIGDYRDRPDAISFDTFCAVNAGTLEIQFCAENQPDPGMY